MKNANNWKLIVFLAVLVSVFFGVRFLRSNRLKTNLPDSIIKIDSAKVTELVITPARQKNNEIRLVKTGKQWTLQTGNRTGHLEQGGANAAIQTLQILRPQSVVTKRREKWNDYNVGDSTGIRVKVLYGESTQADLWIGRTGFTQGTGGMFNGGFTYVRLNGEDEVYTIDAFLEGQFNRTFNDWRDKSFTRLKRDSVDRITFQYPADSSFVLEKKNNHWMINNAMADSAKVTSYINSLEFKNLTAFAEVSPSGQPDVSITFYNKFKSVAKLEAWFSPVAWTLRSSLQLNTYFSSGVSGLDKEIWKGRKELAGVGRK